MCFGRRKTFLQIPFLCKPGHWSFLSVDKHLCFLFLFKGWITRNDHLQPDFQSHSKYINEFLLVSYWSHFSRYQFHHSFRQASCFAPWSLPSTFKYLQRSPGSFLRREQPVHMVQHFSDLYPYSSCFSLHNGFTSWCGPIGRKNSWKQPSVAECVPENEITECLLSPSNDISASYRHE